MPGKAKRGKKVEKRDTTKRQERITRKAIRKGKRIQKTDPEFQLLSNQLSTLRLAMRDVTGDGNCLFRSFADQLQLVKSCDTDHVTIRRDVVEFMRRNEDDFAPFMEEDNMTFDDYLIDLSKDGTFGGNDSIVAFSRCFNCSVIIHQPNAPRWEVHPVGGIVSHPIVNIAYLHGDHYCSVRPAGEEPTSSPPPAVKKRIPQSPPKLHTSVSQVTNEASIGMSGMHELNILLSSTGCEDKELAESVLQDNNYDLSLAIVELMQLMSLTDNQDKVESIPKISEPSAKLSELVTDTVESTSDQLLTEAKKKPSKLSHVTPPQVCEDCIKFCLGNV
jgi:OTU domain-containing protein 3